MVGVNAFAVFASLTLPLAGATACSLSRGPIVEDFVMADAAFVGTIQGYEAVEITEPFENFSMGLLTVRVEKVLHGEISGTVLVRYPSAPTEFTKKSIFAVTHERNFGGRGYKWNQERIPSNASILKKLIVAFQGIGEPVSDWDIHFLGCGVEFLYPYDKSLESQILSIAQEGVPQEIVAQRYERFAQEAGAPIEDADYINSTLPKIQPTRRREYYVYILTMMIAIGSIIYVARRVIRRRRQRKPA